ncbi:sensor histidine kinase [Dactylosporangium sp. CA-233914]|uniref:sensor histidine kinase n=1 Tax=Dactylosporangium sp. CA-233914 TaxID=3239934 RepID=UPI003D923960
MNRFVAQAAVCRAVLLGRLAITVVATAVGIGLLGEVWPTVKALAVIAAATITQLTVLTWRPGVVRWRLSALALDAALMIGLLVLTHGGVAFFCYAAGFAALAGVLLGMKALPLWLADTALGLAVATQLLRSEGITPGRSATAPLVVALPMTDIMCGLGAAAVTAAVMRFIDLSIDKVAAAQRSAAASERARLAREMHDTVAKTLRGVSFAALALPFSLRRHPDLAEQLAATVSEGADTAVREARELLAGLRRDEPDRPFVDNLGTVCRSWADVTGIPVGFIADPVEPPLATRYELAQILIEALHNVEQHARARSVRVGLRRVGRDLELTIHDDGTGFPVPADLSALSTDTHFGIVGMSERARAVDGALDLRSNPEGGTTVLVRVPADRSPFDPAGSGAVTRMDRRC